AQRILNSLMETYITAQIAAKLQATADANAWLNERIAQLRREVEAADQDVQAYRLRFGLVDTRQGTVTQQQVAEINSQLAIAEGEAATAEANLRSVGSGAAARATVDSPLISRQLQREAEGKRQIYQQLQVAAQQTAGAPRSNQADARIITAAVAPSSPTGPRTTLLAAGSALVGLLLAAAAALLLAELDRGFERA